MSYTEKIKDSMISIASLKGSLYCSICDYSLHKYFNLDDGKIYYNESFCKSFIFKYEGYLRWKNILMVEYLHNIINYVKCH